MDETKPERGRNPYAPPAAPVIDPPQTDERGQRPIQVTWAVGALGIYVGMSVLNVAVSWPAYSGRLVTQISLLAVAAMFLAGALWVVYQVWLGKHWARVITLLCALVEVVFLFWAIKQVVTVGLLERILDFESVPVVVAACLLFLPPARQWFRRPSAS